MERHVKPDLNLGHDASEVHSTEVAFLLLVQRPCVCFSAFPKMYCDVAEIYRRRWLGESGLRFENVYQTHQVLASGNLVLQKHASELAVMP